MSDPKVEEARAYAGKMRTDALKTYDRAYSQWCEQTADHIDYLLTKLDEAEKDTKTMVGRFDRTRERMIAAVERERVVLAGVREALTAIQRDVDRLANLDAAELKAILSRLLPSTPTEEGKTE